MDVARAVRSTSTPTKSRRRHQQRHRDREEQSQAKQQKEEEEEEEEIIKEKAGVLMDCCKVEGRVCAATEEEQEE